MCEISALSDKNWPSYDPKRLILEISVLELFYSFVKNQLNNEPILMRFFASSPHDCPLSDKLWINSIRPVVPSQLKIVWLKNPVFDISVSRLLAVCNFFRFRASALKFSPVTQQVLGSYVLKFQVSSFIFEKFYYRATFDTFALYGDTVSSFRVFELDFDSNPFISVWIVRLDLPDPPDTGGKSVRFELDRQSLILLADLIANS